MNPPFRRENPVAPLAKGPEKEFLAIFCEGKVRRIPVDITPEKLAAYITRAGGDYDQP